jgi:hypothetical protein
MTVPHIPEIVFELRCSLQQDHDAQISSPQDTTYHGQSVLPTTLVSE